MVYIGKGPYRMFSKYIFLNILITFLHGQLSKLYEYLNGRTNLAKRLLRSYTLIKKKLISELFSQKNIANDNHLEFLKKSLKNRFSKDIV